MASRSLGTVIKDLFFALLNATLILIALCLWLAWQVSGAINSAASEFAGRLTNIETVRADIGGLRTEVAAFRSDLANLDTGTGENTSVAVARIQSRLNALEQRVGTTFDKLEAVAAHPETLVNYAVDRTAEQIKGGVETVLQCKASPPAETEG